MSFIRRLLFGKKKRGSRSNPVRPQIPLHQPAPNPFADILREASRPSHYVTQQIPNNSGYILLTNKKDHDNQLMGRHLEFDSNRGNFGDFIRGNRRGETEKVILDGHVIWEGQIRNSSVSKLRNEFFDDWDIQQLTHSQVANILAEDENDPDMFGATAAMDNQIEANIEDQLDDLRAELEEEYVERFEEDYQRRFKQEYPEKFSKDFQEHYNDMVVDELDEVVDDHEELYEEYIVSDQHIRYKR